MKRSMKKDPAALVLAGLILTALAGCGVPENTGPEELRILTWNVQALFDGEETGNEYAEYRTGPGWTGEKYRARLTALSLAIGQLSEGGNPAFPGVAALEELENSGVLEDLAAALAKYGYNWTFFAANPGASLGIGVLSRFPFTATGTHSAYYFGEYTPRPVLELRIEPAGRPVTLLICHWKSKLGGDTEPLRRAAARLIQRRLGELRQEDADMPVIVLGDLNENHDEFYRLDGEAICALLPKPAAEKLGFGTENISNSTKERPAARDFLIIDGEKPPLPGVLYSPWYELEQKGSRGSYYYRDKWETIDHVLLTGELFDFKGWDFESCILLDREPFINSQGLPAVYNPRTGSGLSDHLPLLLILAASGGGS
ncbi:MAG: endonuclease/exonuclease/phosphatase family protein [Treponema sp.]|nr:endonuclease/exonuclease/phosphatase family protein [Treponema sp.]